MPSVQALETIRKLNEIKSYVRNTLEKLPGIRADLVRLDDSWQDWGFCELVEAYSYLPYLVMLMPYLVILMLHCHSALLSR